MKRESNAPLPTRVTPMLEVAKRDWTPEMWARHIEYASRLSAETEETFAAVSKRMAKISRDEARKERR